MVPLCTGLLLSSGVATATIPIVSCLNRVCARLNEGVSTHTIPTFDSVFEFMRGRQGERGVQAL